MMNLSSLPPVVQKLTALGDAWGQQPEEWVDYQKLGISRENVPLLIEIVQRADEFWEDEEEPPESWTPVHAWRALAQLQAEEAIPVLVDQLRKIDEDDNDLIQEEIPYVLGTMGPAALPALKDRLSNRGNLLWAPLEAAEAMKIIAMAHTETRDEVVGALGEALEPFATNDETLNSFLISNLADLKAVEAAPLVEQAFASDRVDESIIGDWEDYQVAVGLLERRLSPPRSVRLLPLDGHEPFAPQPGRHKQEDKAAKKKRKEASASRKKNRKGGKKKKKK